MDDESFEQLFVPVMDTIMNRYQPDAIVLQSGELAAMWQGGGGNGVRGGGVPRGQGRGVCRG